MAGTILYEQVITLPANAFSVAVTLDHALADANYEIAVTKPYPFDWWLTLKTSTGFTFNVDTNNYNQQSIRIILMRE